MALLLLELLLFLLLDRLVLQLCVVRLVFFAEVPNCLYDRDDIKEDADLLLLVGFDSEVGEQAFRSHYFVSADDLGRKVLGHAEVDLSRGVEDDGHR